MSLKYSLLGLALLSSASMADISYYPVTPNSTEGAQKLYNFLARNYGEKTVSGIMTGDLDGGSAEDVTKTVDVEAVFKVTQKNPALVGFDFLFATGVKAEDSWYKSYTEKSIALAKDLWKKGGIPAFTWHWKDPSYATESYKPEEVGFKFENAYTLSNGNFSWNKNSDEYKWLIRDIDIVADYFLELQKEGVAAIWRPLHEASGNISNKGTAWFWWGMNGDTPCAELYKLIYEEFVNVKGVKNLVWDWNPQMANDLSWSPGETKYDFLTLDIYGANDYKTKFVTGYNDLVKNFGTDKILAISENGPIPDISAMKENKTVYAWWMMWYESPSWEGYFVSKQNAPAVLKANMEDPCTINLDDMPGWNTYKIEESKVAACKSGYSLADIDQTIPQEEVQLGDGWMRVVIDGIDPVEGILIEYTPKEKQSGIKDVSLTFKNQSNDGIWIGLAIVTDDSKDPTWQWEMSPTTSCWLNPGDSTTCTFDMTTYENDDGVTLPMDADRIFKYCLMFSAENGYSGTVWVSNFTSNVGVISDFMNANDLFKKGEKTEGLKEITTPIRARVLAKNHSLSVLGNTLSISLGKASNAYADVFDIQGNRVKTLHRGSLSAGTHHFSLESLSRGTYIVRVRGKGFDLSKKVILK